MNPPSGMRELEGTAWETAMFVEAWGHWSLLGGVIRILIGSFELSSIVERRDQKRRCVPRG